jgi:hypothetical protein
MNSPISQNMGVHRVTSDSKRGKQFISQTKQYGNFSGHTPHIGKKQIHKGHKQKGIQAPNCEYCLKEFNNYLPNQLRNESAGGNI